MPPAGDPAETPASISVPAGSGTVPEPERPACVASPNLFGRVVLLKRWARGLEVLLWVALVGSVAIIDHALLWTLLWVVVPLAAVAVPGQMHLVRELQARLGRQTAWLQPDGRWLLLGTPAGPSPWWGFDLRRPAAPPMPLLVPGLLLAPWVPTVLAVVAMHAVAAAALEHEAVRQRFRRGIELYALGVAAWAFFGPAWGPFATPEPAAAFLLVLMPIVLAGAGESWSAYRLRVGSRSNLRRYLVSLSTVEGVRFLHAALPALACAGLFVAAVAEVSWRWPRVLRPDAEHAVPALLLTWAMGAALWHVRRDGGRITSVLIVVGLIVAGWDVPSPAVPVLVAVLAAGPAARPR